MALKLDSLKNYVDEQRLPLIRKVAMSPKSASIFSLVTGVKGATALNLIDTTVSLQDGTVCGWNDKGVSALTQRQLVPGNISVQMSFCDKSLLKYWTSYEVAVAAGRKSEDMPFEEDFINSVIEKIGDANEKLIWQGDTSSLDENLSKTDGLLKLINAEGEVIKQTATTSETMFKRVFDVYNAIPDNALEKSAIFMNFSNFRKLVQELVDKNLYHYTTNVDKDMKIVLPGTNTIVYGVQGLSGKDSIISLVPEHTFYGVDLESDVDDFDCWYSKDNQEYRLSINYVLAVNFAFADEVVINTVA